MSNPLCREAQIISGFEAPTRPAKTSLSSISANDLLVNVSWPLILILAIAAITAAGQAQAIKDISIVIEKWDDDGKSDILIEIFQQQLIRKIDAACTKKQKELKIDLFPNFARVSTRAGMPDDPDFAGLCRRASDQLQNIEELVKTIYAAALEHTEVGVERMYDPVVFPGTSPNVNAPNVIGLTAKAGEHREFAMRRIRERCIDWRAHIVQVQRHAIDHMLDSPAVQSVLDADRDQMTAKIRSTFANNGYALLPETL